MTDLLSPAPKVENREEPWLRGTLTDVPVVPRAVLHVLQLAREDVERWCSGLTDDEINARPAGLAPVSFHIRHIANSTDRLLTYAEGRGLTAEQLAIAKAEMQLQVPRAELMAEFKTALERSAQRVRALYTDPSALEQPRTVGRKRLPTTVGGLLIHVADHAQRHVGQAVVTAKLVMSDRERPRTTEPKR